MCELQKVLVASCCCFMFFSSSINFAVTADKISSQRLNNDGSEDAKTVDATFRNQNFNAAEKRNFYMTAGNTKLKSDRGDTKEARNGWSKWSQTTQCSRPCGGGVEVWSRECLQQENGCFGQKEMFRICNKQRCSVNNDDFKALQCNRVGHKLHPNSADWSPVIEEHRACALTCRSPMSGHVEQLWENVVDGTQCRSGSLDMCVRGKCMRVGCNAEIGLNLILDTCGVCGGDGSTCQRPNIYHWKTTGFSRCSETCGGGWQHTDVVCVYRLTNNDNANFTATTNAFDSSAAPPVADQFCAGMRQPEIHSQRCNLHPCLPASVDVVYAWTPDEWGPCTNSCGRGTHGRRVVCGRYIRSSNDDNPGTVNGGKHNFFINKNERDPTRAVEPVEHKYCQKMRRPAVSEACVETRGCAELGAAIDDDASLAPFRWSVGQWSTCTPMECGMGVRRRQVKCVKNSENFSNINEAKRKVLNDVECERYSPPDVRKPHSKEHCYTDELCGQSLQFEPNLTGPMLNESKFKPIKLQANMIKPGTLHGDEEIFMLPADQPVYSRNNNNNMDENIQALPLVSPLDGTTANQVTTLDAAKNENKLDPQESHVEFVTSSWSPCSQTCTGTTSGFMTRTVDCFIWLERSLAVVKLSESECESKEKRPPTTQPCSDGLPPCEPDKYNEKSVIVGIYPSVDQGMAMSSSASLSPMQNVFPGSKFNGNNNNLEGEFSWQYLWTNCTLFCGGGVQTGRPFCMEQSSHSPVEDEYCLNLYSRPPTAERQCNDQPCENDEKVQVVGQPRWHLISETACFSKPNNKKCNLNGLKKRKYVCITNNGKKYKKVNVEVCKRLSAMPPTRIKCKLDENADFQIDDSCQQRRRRWRTGHWSACPSTCGTNVYRQRSVFCEERKPNGLVIMLSNETDADSCGNDRRKPSNSEICQNLPPCPTTHNQNSKNDFMAIMHDNNQNFNDDDSVTEVELHHAPSTTSFQKNKIIRLKLGTYRQRPDQRTFEMKIGETAYVYADTYLRLRCPVRRGFDKSGIRWLKDGQVLLTQRGRGHFRITRHGALKIRRLRQLDQGIYTCVADKDRANSRIFVLHRAPLLFDDLATDSSTRRRQQQQISLPKEENLPIMPSSGARWQLPPDKSWGKAPPPPGAPPYYYYGYGFYGQGRNYYNDNTNKNSQFPPNVAMNGGANADDDNFNHDEDGDDDRQVDTVSAIIRPRPIDTTPMPVVEISTTTIKVRTSTMTSRLKAEDLLRIEQLRTALEQSWSRALPPVDKNRARLELRDNGQQVQITFDERSKNIVTFEWREGSWSECNATCGKRGGIQVRPVYCLASQSGDMRAVQVVEISICSMAGLRSQPETQQRCQQDVCPQWRAGQWSECLPEKCFQLHLSQRERRIYCGHENGTEVDDMFCAVDSANDDDNPAAKQKPPMTERCPLQQCEPHWIAMPWTPCSKTCGLAMRARNINCVWRNTNVYAGELCQALPQPPATEKCDGLPKCREDNLCKDVSKFCGLAANLNLCTLHEYAVKCCRSCSLRQQIDKRRHYSNGMELSNNIDAFASSQSDDSTPSRLKPMPLKAQVQQSTLGSFSLRDAKLIHFLNEKNSYNDHDNDNSDDKDNDDAQITASDSIQRTGARHANKQENSKRYFHQHIAQHVPDALIHRL